MTSIPSEGPLDRRAASATRPRPGGVPGLRAQTVLAAAIGGILASAAAGQERSASPALEEVVVTATRRAESVLEIPLNISVATGETLERLAVRDLTGIATAVPGLVATDQGVRNNGTNNSFIIRGVNATSIGLGSFQNLIAPAVSTYVDETPLFANLRLTDIDRVEVLRGPQGTLYGAGSVGGTIRLIQAAPSTEATEFRVTAEGGTVEESDDYDYRADFVANVPISERFAVRVSGGYEQLAGFIDATRAVAVDGNGVPLLANPADPVGSTFVTRSLEDVDSSSTWFVRASARYDFNDRAKLVLAYQHQDEKAEAFSARQLGTRGYTIGKRIVDEPSDRKVDFVSATATVDLGFATLTSATGYFEQGEASVTDASTFPIAFAQYYGYYPRIALLSTQDFDVESLTQEFRLVSSGDGAWQWTAGAFIQDLRSRVFQVQQLKGIADWSELPGTGFGPFPRFGDVQEYFGFLRPSQIQPRDMTYLTERDVKFEDKSLFGEVTYNITEAWTVTGGVRVFWQDTSQDLLAELPYFGPIVAADGNIFGRNRDFSEAKFDDQIFKFNTAYRLSDQALLYATVSEGFRAGGANSYPVGTCAFCDPPDFLTYLPDTATNYEVGIKGRVGGSLQYSVGVFRIDWKDIQLEASSASANAIIVNGSKAQSEGLELEATWVPLDDLRFTAGYSYVDAKLAADVFLPVGGQLGPGGGSKGDPLPGVSEHQFAGAIDYRWPLGDSRALVLHLNGAYRSEFANRLAADAANYRTFDGFWLFNASIGLELSDNLQVMLYGRNLSNEEGVTAYARPTFSGNAGSPPPEYSFEFLQRPRALGLRVVWSY
ncbi:MAG: TonB-dependent receptor [Steroidobacteraceae bacterium]|nr:TonB-dependent receptor [Steroidobacteraceae bacterium]